MEKIECFDDWWKINGADYEKEGVKKLIAKSIWGAAIDLLQQELFKKLRNELDKV